MNYFRNKKKQSLQTMLCCALSPLDIIQSRGAEWWAWSGGQRTHRVRRALHADLFQDTKPSQSPAPCPQPSYVIFTLVKLLTPIQSAQNITNLK